jgi:REG-2-like HAD superfamily hydrolase
VTPQHPVTPDGPARARRYGALFLDVGETLVYAHPSPAEVMADVCVGAGLDVTAAAIEAAESEVWPAVVARQSAMGADELYSVSAENSRRFWGWVYDAILGALDVPIEARPGLAQGFHNRFSSLETWHLFPDAIPALEAIERRRQGGLKVGVVSNWEDWLEALLLQLEVHHYFDFLVVSAGVRSEKPDPAIFRAALARSGVRPEETLHVGDSLHADVGGARACGITPVLLDRRGRYTPDQVQGGRLIRSLAELPDLLDGALID